MSRYKYKTNLSFFNTSVFSAVGRISYRTYFSRSQSKILWILFEKDRYISRIEAERLAKKFQVSPERIQTWFQRKRNLEEESKALRPKGKHVLNVSFICIEPRLERP